jgi:hypothetical protein
LAAAGQAWARFSSPLSGPRPPDSNRLRADRPVTELPGLDADQTARNDGIPASHRLTPLEVKLLDALQKILMEDTTMLQAIHRYKIPVRKKVSSAEAK